MSFRIPEDNLRLASKLTQILVKVTRYVCVVDGDKIVHYMILKHWVK
jgi:hypothetical protein